jgi:hypothetical protein
MKIKRRYRNRRRRRRRRDRAAWNSDTLCARVPETIKENGEVVAVLD